MYESSKLKNKLSSLSANYLLLIMYCISLQERILTLAKSPNSSFSSQQGKASAPRQGAGAPGDKIFELFYEKNPVNSTAKYRCVYL